MVSVGDVSVAEGNSGTLNATFIVSVSSAAHTGITFNIATAADETGSSRRDCRRAITQARVGDESNDPGWHDDVHVRRRDLRRHGPRTRRDLFPVNLTSVTGATLLDGQGLGTISNDEAPPPRSAPTRKSARSTAVEAMRAPR